MAPHADEDADAHIFAGVRFALVGFDVLSKSEFRSEIERYGGVDAGSWDDYCTHVIVDGLLYNDPVCVAARADGKKVVTVKWLEDSLELGELADADRVLYAPLRDPKGIPGSDKLHICLTGYQKDRREDIMKMVSMMGATFSKSLVPYKATHLICYKFEGEKYAQAKRFNVNLVNHRWIEDCLKAWEILPIDEYTKSGWELEMMEARVEDSEDETEGVGRRPSISKRIGRSSPITEIIMKSHLDSDVNASVRGPAISSSNADGSTGRHLHTPEQIMKAEDVSTKSFDLRDDLGCAPNTSSATISVDHSAHKSTQSRVYHSENDEAPTGYLSQDEAKDDHTRAPDARAGALCTPNVHENIAPAIQADNRENIDGNCLHNSNQINVDNVLRSNSSLEMSRKVDQKDDGHIPDLKPTICPSYVEEKLDMHESNLRSEGNSASRNSQILGYSRRCSSKSVSPGANLRSVQHTASPQCFEGNTSRVELNTPLRKNDQDFSEHADTQSLQENEVIKHVKGSSSALAHRKNSILSSDSSKPPNGAPGSGLGTATSPVSNKECSSEAAVSTLGRSVESTKVDGPLNSGPTVNVTEKQMPGSFKSNFLSCRRKSLKLISSAEVEKPPEHSANDKSVGALRKVKAPALQEATPEKDCAVYPPVNSEIRKESSGASLQNGDIEMTDARQVNNEIGAPNSEPEKVTSHQNLEAGPKDMPVNTITDAHGSFSVKASTSRVRKGGVKRSRIVGRKTAADLINSEIEVAASLSIHDKVVSCENVETQQREKRSSPNAVECTPSFPAEVRNKKSSNKVLSSSSGPNCKTNDALAASKAEFANKNMRGNHRKLSSAATVDENRGTSSQRVPNSISRNSVAKGSRTTGVHMTDTPSVDKTETMSLKSNFNEVVPPENGDAFPKMLSSSASADDPETCTANEVPNNRVRKVVAKRKLSAVQKHKSDSEPCKTAGGQSTAQSSGDAAKVAMDQDENINDRANDAVGPSCKDAMEDRAKDKNTSISRGSKRQKISGLVDGSADHDKENIPVNSNSTSRTKYRNHRASSKSITKALQNRKPANDERRMIGRNDCGILNVPEPTWFILSGHRLMRKEYKAILRRLKGRLCRDSHHWSFQATHLVTPELRRTEKFFAAAAAGRWILKPDYLTACNEAGKLLEEEPFEWHGEGLNSGETISLDAPRKWRRLKQRTGHGAFHGMRIIIYGECIAPTLDTLKRTIRSGDGTILATSPPYTRFLESSVDFAVVSAGMPSVDAWVQEFMRHKIPCISADYLVEYVCKPGHSLSKHVLFNMHDLADKSLQKLLKNQEDATGEAEADVSCSACVSNDREGLVPICGSDGNQAVADGGEWLCHKCDAHKSAKKPAAGSRSRVLKGRRL